MKRWDGQQGDHLRDCQTWGHQAAIAAKGTSVSTKALALLCGNVCSCLFRWAWAQNKVEKKKSTCRGFLSTAQQGNDQPHGGGTYGSEDQTGEVS